MKQIQKIVASGYFLITLLIGGIVYTWNHEWQEIENLESDNRQIDELRKEINDVHIRLIEFSLLGETVLEWDDEDMEHYHDRRMAMDSMLFRFKAIYPAEHIDSVSYLLEDKERQMCGIVKLLDEQQALNEKFVNQVPVIVQKSVQEQPKKLKTKRIFGHLRQKKRK